MIALGAPNPHIHTYLEVRGRRQTEFEAVLLNPKAMQTSLLNIYSPFITTEQAGQALVLVAKQGDVESVAFILDERHDVTPPMIAQALNTAIVEGHDGIVDLFLKERRIAPAELEVALAFAAKLGRLSIVKQIFAQDELSAAGIRSALSYARSNRHEETARYLKGKLARAEGDFPHCCPTM